MLFKVVNVGRLLILYNMCLIMVMGDFFGGFYFSVMYFEELDINLYGWYCKMILNLFRVL